MEMDARDENPDQKRGWCRCNNFLAPLALSTVVLVTVKGIFVLIFPNARVGDDEMQLYTTFVHSESNVGLLLYDTALGLVMYAAFLAILYCPWERWTAGGVLNHSKLVVVHAMLAVLAYVALVVAPYADTYFKAQMEGDWFFLVKRMSILIGWVCLLLVEFVGRGPSHWTSHVTALVLSLNILEAVLLSFGDLRQYPSGVVLLCIVPFSPMIYVDRDRGVLTSTTDYAKHRPFYAVIYKRNPFSERWYYRLYCVAILSMCFLSDYFQKHGILNWMTLCLPLLTAEIRCFHSEPARRFEKYTEIFFLTRVSPLWVFSLFGFSIREVGFSYVDSSFAQRYSFYIENVALRNVIEVVYLVASISWLACRDKKELAVLSGGEGRAELNEAGDLSAFAPAAGGDAGFAGARAGDDEEPVSGAPEGHTHNGDTANGVETGIGFVGPEERGTPEEETDEDGNVVYAAHLPSGSFRNEKEGKGAGNVEIDDTDTDAGSLINEDVVGAELWGKFLTYLDEMEEVGRKKENEEPRIEETHGGTKETTTADEQESRQERSLDPPSDYEHVPQRVGRLSVRQDP